ncbi:MAG: diguanylate cyclase [Bacteroidetes bacterium]|nr:diguanylate cyclase [Bacteroidota bacterium]
MIYYIVTQFINAFIVVIIGLIVFFENRKETINKIFLFYTFAMAIWAFSFAKMCLATSPQQGLFWSRALHVGAVTVPAFLLHFVLAFLGKAEKQKIIIKVAYSISLLISIFIPTKFLVSHTVAVVGFKYFVGPAGWYYHFFPVFFATFTGYTFYELIKAIKYSKGQKKNQIVYLLIALVVAYGGGSFGFAPLYGIAIPKFAFTTVSIYSFMIAYIIIKYSFMNIAWRQVFEYLIYLCAVVILYKLINIFLLITSINHNVAFIMAALILAVTIPILKKYILIFTNSLLLKKYQIIWHKLANLASRGKKHYKTADVVGLITAETSEILNLKGASYYTPYKDREEELVFKSLSNQELANQEICISYFKNNKEAFLYKQYLKKDQDKLAKFLNNNEIELCLAIFNKGLIIGLVAYQEKQSGDLFHREEIQIIQNIINNAEEQIQNILQIDDISNNYADQRLNIYKDTYQTKIIQKAYKMTYFDSVNDLCDYTCKIINRSIEASFTNVYLYSAKKKAYLQKTCIGNYCDKNESIKESSYFIKYIMQRSGLLYSADIENIATSAKTKDWQKTAALTKALQAEIIIPMHDKITMFGFITIGKPYKNKVYNENQITLLNFLPFISQLTISNIQMRKQVETDEMTGVHNKIFLQRLTNESVSESLKSGQSVTYLMLDADDFKLFNNFGYDVGDKVLKSIADALKNITRPHDYLCRFGGEEFLIIAPDTNLKEGETLAKRIVEYFKTDPSLQELGKQYNKQISLSIGVSSFNPEEKTEDFSNDNVIQVSSTLFTHSNKAIKEAKKKGKACFVSTPIFTKEEAGTKMILFPLSIMIITDNDIYRTYKIDNTEITTSDSLADILANSHQFDVVIIDTARVHDDIASTIIKFREINRNLLVGVTSANPKDKIIASEHTAEFFLTPLEPNDLEKWIIYLRAIK